MRLHCCMQQRDSKWEDSVASVEEENETLAHDRWMHHWHQPCRFSSTLMKGTPLSSSSSTAVMNLFFFQGHTHCNTWRIVPDGGEETTEDKAGHNFVSRSSSSSSKAVQETKRNAQMQLVLAYLLECTTSHHTHTQMRMYKWRKIGKENVMALKEMGIEWTAIAGCRTDICRTLSWHASSPAETAFSRTFHVGGATSCATHWPTVPL